VERGDEATPIEVIPNFVDSDAFRPLAAPDDLAAHFPDGERGPLLVHSSNFRPLKRVGDAVRLLALVRREVPARLALVGDGPERPAVAALARELGVADAVAFLGERLELAPILAAGRVFLLPSETESFGLAALEAMACAVPVVATRSGGLPEVVTDGSTGLLHAVGDVAAMAASVIALLRDEPRRRAMGDAARADAVHRFAREPAVDRYEALYRRLLA
jgi:N-acetyl-alpha-D-glucosaminyl L-malate synthase BshA